MCLDSIITPQLCIASCCGSTYRCHLNLLTSDEDSTSVLSSSPRSPLSPTTASELCVPMRSKLSSRHHVSWLRLTVVIDHRERALLHIDAMVNRSDASPVPTLGSSLLPLLSLCGQYNCIKHDKAIIIISIYACEWPVVDVFELFAMLTPYTVADGLIQVQ